MTTAPRSWQLIGLVIVGALVVVNARILVGGRTWDDAAYHTQVAPPRLAAAESVWSGALPAWWEGSGLGVPLASDPGHGAMYPATWLAPTPHALDLLAIAHLIWAALGIALWARRRDASEPACVAAGLLVATSGLFASLVVRGALPAIAHLPWIGLCASMLAEARTSRARARAAIAIAVLLGAIALTGVLGCLVSAIAIVGALAPRRGNARWIVVAIGAGLAIGAAQWIPAAMFLADRAGAGAPAVHGLPWARLLELIVPARGITTSGWAPSLFVGAPLLALAAVRPPSRRTTGLVLGLAAAALVVGRGGWPAWLGAPELQLAALVVVLAPLAAIGFDALVAGGRRALLAFGAGAAFAGIALGAVVAQRSRHPDAADAIDRALVDGALGLVCMIAALVVAWRVRRSTAFVVLALVVLPGVGALDRTSPVILREAVDEPPPFAVAALAHPTSGAPRRIYRPQFMFEARQSTEELVSTLGGAAGWRWGLGSARSEDPARLPVHDEFWLAAASEGGALLDRFGIELAILPSSIVVPRKLKALATRGRWALVALPVAPAAGVLHGSLWVIDPVDAMALMFPGGGIGVLQTTVVLRGRGEARQIHRPVEPCEILRWEPGAIDLRCTTQEPGYAAVSSSNNAGWHVTVDGTAAAWLGADVLRRAVAIEPGTHLIEWRYRAPGLALGGLLAAIALAGLVALLVTTRTRPTPTPTRDDAN